MTDYAINTAPIAALPIAGEESRFPVRRVYCIGRTYAAHAIEMGHYPDREIPFFFRKNSDNPVSSGEFPHPPRSTQVHPEAKMLVALKSGGRNIPVDRALDLVFADGLARDMTRRDLQGIAKKAGRPWAVGKAFERSAHADRCILPHAFATARSPVWAMIWEGMT